MKILSINQFKNLTGEERSELGPPQHGQLVRIKGKLTQFVVPPTYGENCINCYFEVHDACHRIACGNGHFAPISTPTDIFTTPKEQV